MATKKKMLQAAAGNAGGAALDITDVFSTYLYEGTNQADTIVNNIDLSGEGGMTWIKERTGTSGNVIFDTERGATKRLISYATNAESTAAFDVTAFNSDGFSVGDSIQVNGPSRDYASWTFRKAPKFFDVVTYTGDGVTGRTVSHNLGTTVGTIIVKKTNASRSWYVYHRSLGATYYSTLNLTEQPSENNTFWNNTEPTSSEFTVGTDTGVNNNGDTYVAYLFAHNDGDGDFGPDGDQDIIKCGSYSQSSASDVDVDLGFEPQFVIVKRSDDTSQWYILDEMRGFLAGSNSTSSRTLYASLANAEADFTIQKTATGFTWPSGQYGSGTQEYIYMAIRRGPLAQPESGTEVFALEDDGASANSEGVYFTSNFPVDFALLRERTNSSDGWYTMSRLQGNGNYMKTNSTAAEASGVSNGTFDHMTGWYQVGSASMSWMWKRAPGFFDVVPYIGDNTVGQTVAHNLGVSPELIITKLRDYPNDWVCWASGLNNNQFLKLNTTDAAALNFSGAGWLPTPTTFNADYYMGPGANYATDQIAYLFASLPGISKVGSYTGNGTSQTINCGFTSGARFVLIKRTDAVGSWFVWDAERGIVSGNEPYLTLNQTSAEDSGSDTVDPDSSGFIVNETNYLNQNTSGASYIFYAIA